MKIYIKVKPNSNEKKIERISGNEYVISVKERAEKGKANERVRKLISKKFNVSLKNVTIKTKKGRRKVVEIF